MYDTKCIRLLKRFTKSELNKFEIFLNALYRRKKKEIALFEYIKPLAPQCTAKELDRHFAINNQLKKQGFLRKTLDQNLSGLVRIIEDFWLWEKMKKQQNTFNRQMFLLEIYEERKLMKLFQLKVQQLTKSIHKKGKNMWGYLQLMRLARARYLFNPTPKKRQDDPLHQIMKNLDGFFISAKLKYACEQNNRKRITGQDYERELLDLALDLSDKPPYNENVFLQIHRLVLELDEDPDNIEKYYTLRDLIYENYHKVEKLEQPFYFAFLSNYISIHLKKGQRDMSREIFNLFDFKIKEGIILEGKYIPPAVFTNHIHLGWQLIGIDFAQTCIDRYQQYLNPKNKKEALCIANAEINFAKGNYEEAFDALAVTNFPSGILNLQARLLLLKLHYELERDDAYVEASQRYSNRANNLSEHNKKSLQNTLKYMRQLRCPNTEKNELIRQIKSTEFLFNRSWLLQKAEERQP